MLFVHHRSFGSNTPKIQQRRNLGRAGTTVISVPDLPLIAVAAKQLVLGIQCEMSIDIGQSFCHPKDQFSRKVGLDVANKKIVSYTFRTAAILVNRMTGANRTKLLLVDIADGRKGVEIEFSFFDKYCRVMLVDLSEKGEADDKQCSGNCSKKC